MLNENMMVKPRVIINVKANDNCDDLIIELQAGLEEEGVPYTLINGNNHDVTELAWQGANASLLGVGIGVSSQGICIHYHKLPEHEPLYITGGGGDREEWRRFGANAARLVKGLPFKTEAACELVPDTDLTELYAVVRTIVKVVMQEFAQFNGR